MKIANENPSTFPVQRKDRVWRGRLLHVGRPASIIRGIVEYRVIINIVAPTNSAEKF